MNLMNLLELPKDINNICISYFTEDEIIYFNNEWNKFLKSHVCNIAAKNGWIDLLKWARERKYRWNILTCIYAAENGHLELLRLARMNGCQWNSTIWLVAAENGYFEILKYLKNNGCPMNLYTCGYAARGGHLDAIKWLILLPENEDDRWK